MTRILASAEIAAKDARIAALEAALREAVQEYHVLDGVRHHVDDTITTGWERAPFDRCEDLLCSDARALLAGEPAP